MRTVLGPFLWRLIPMVLILGLVCAGCAPQPHSTSPQVQVASDLSIQMATDPTPPRVGDNTLVLTITNSTTHAPVVDANVTVSAFNQLAGGGDTQTGRSQGNGVYNVPVKLPIPDSYTAGVVVQRLGHPDVAAKFPLDVN